MAAPDISLALLPFLVMEHISLSKIIKTYSYFKNYIYSVIFCNSFGLEIREIFLRTKLMRKVQLFSHSGWLQVDHADPKSSSSTFKWALPVAGLLTLQRSCCPLCMCLNLLGWNRNYRDTQLRYFMVKKEMHRSLRHCFRFLHHSNSRQQRSALWGGCGEMAGIVQG